jgi:hypothetical protein
MVKVVERVKESFRSWRDNRHSVMEERAEEALEGLTKEQLTVGISYLNFGVKVLFWGSVLTLYLTIIHTLFLVSGMLVLFFLGAHFLLAFQAYSGIEVIRSEFLWVCKLGMFLLLVALVFSFLVAPAIAGIWGYLSAGG